MSIHRRSLSLTLPLALLLGAAALASPAQAQSCPAPLAVHSSYPADGATGVPTNSAVYVYGPALEVASSDVVLRDGTGAEVSIEVMATEGGLFVDPFLGFTPGTTYELSVSPAGADEWSATFTTGTGPALPSEVLPPMVSVSVIDQDRGSCGVVSAICVDGTVPARMTVEVLVGDEVMSLGGGELAPAFPASGANIAANGCVEVRVREPGGAVSETTRLCGAQLGRFELEANAAAPRSCEPYRVAAAPADEESSDSSSESGGCALGAPGSTGAGGGVLLALSALLMARQRRRAR